MTEVSKARTGELPWWLPEQLLLVSMVVCLGPGAFGVLSAAHGRLALGLGILGLWLVPYVLLLRVLHRRHIVRLAVSLPCTAGVLAAMLFIP